MDSILPLLWIDISQYYIVYINIVIYIYPCLRVNTWRTIKKTRWRRPKLELTGTEKTQQLANLSFPNSRDADLPGFSWNIASYQQKELNT